MANPTCTRSSLMTTNPAFGLQGFTPRQYRAAKLYLMALELKGVGGTDYTSAMTTTLISDAITLVGNGQNDPNQMRIAMLQVQRNNTAATGETVPSTFNALNAATKCCFQNMEAPFDAMELLLLCKLGVHKTYPQ